MDEEEQRLERGRERWGSKFPRPLDRLTCGDLRQIMREKNMTAAQVAQIISRPRKTVIGWVRHEGPTDPGFPIPLSFADALKLMR